MNRKKILFLVSLYILLLGLVTQSSLAFQENGDSQHQISSFDRFAWKWSPTEVVSTESTSNSVESSFAIDSAGNIHLAWRDHTDYDSAGTDPDIFYKRWDAISSSWTATEVVSTESTGAGPIESYTPSLDVDSFGNIHIAWYDQTDYLGAGTDWDIFYKRWDAISSSWTTTEVVSSGFNGNAFDASLAVDSVGNVHIAWRDETNYDFAGTDWDIFYKRWDILSSSWTTTEVVSTESTLNSISPSLAVDPSDDIHIAWYDSTDILSSGSDADIFYKRLDVLSSSWTSTEVVSTESSGDSYYPTLIVDSASNTHIAWHDTTNYASSGTDQDIFYKRLDAHSSSWTTTEVVSTQSTGHSYYSSLAVDTSGDIQVAWYDITNYASSGADLDIFYKRLDTLSSSWTTTEVVSTESTGHSNYPSLAVDPSGTIHAVWDDITDYDSAGGDRDIFYKQLTGLPTSPDLAFIVPNPDEDGVVNLYWSDVLGATTYYIYRSDSYIFSVEELTPFSSTSNSYYVDTLPSTGFYYYVIVAENFVGNSTQSNCQYIEYKIPTLNEFAITFGIIGGVAVVLITITRFRKKKKQNNIQFHQLDLYLFLFLFSVKQEFRPQNLFI